MQMSTNYTVKPGDNLTKIALSHGFKSYRDIYDHPLNAAFRAKRPNPNLIFAGDVIVIPDRGGPGPLPPPSPVPPTPPPAPPTPPAAKNPREEALDQRPLAIFWVDRAIFSLEALKTFIPLGVPDALNVHAPTREALRVHFHMNKADDNPVELNFILGRFKDIRILLNSEAEAQFHTATPEQEATLKRQFKGGLPMAITDNRFLGKGGITFTQSYLGKSDNCKRLILIHEGLHFVDPKPLGPNIVDIGEGDPRYDDPNVLPLEKAIHNPSSYAASAWQLANGSDGARRFCS